MAGRLRESSRCYYTRKEIRNRFAYRTVIFFLMRHFAFYILRGRRLALLLFTCALFAAGCAHDSSDNWQGLRHRHDGGGQGRRETVTEIPDSTPAPSPGPF
jgi:hypothetical protein